jgi:hypothetical protein
VHSAQFAPVAFQFQRKGHVKVALDRDDNVADRTERLIDVALESTADDFKTIESSNHSMEIVVWILFVQITCLVLILSSVYLSAKLFGDIDFCDCCFWTIR